MAEATLAITFIGLDEALSHRRDRDSDGYQAQKRAEPMHVDALAANAALGVRHLRQAPSPGHEVAASSTTRASSLGDRQVGEIWVKGPSHGEGLLRRPEVATERTFGGGWLRTGDLGYLANGNVYITGRKKDLIIINGRNYDPQRIEWVVDEVPEVRRGLDGGLLVPGAVERGAGGRGRVAHPEPGRAQASW